MPAVSARVDLGDVGLAAASRQASDSAPPERSSSATSAPRLRCASTSVLQQLAVRAALGLDRARGRSATGRRRGGSTTGQVVRSEDSTSSTARGSRLTNRISPVGQQRQADLERGGAGAGVEGEERVVGLGGGEQLARRAARPRRACRASAPRGRRRLPVARSTIGWKCGVICAVREELGEPVGARAVEQRLGRDRQALLVGEATANRQARSECESEPRSVLEALLPAGAGEQRGPRRRCRPRRARSRGARPCRARTDGATAVARRPWLRWPPTGFIQRSIGRNRPLDRRA